MTERRSYSTGLVPVLVMATPSSYVTAGFPATGRFLYGRLLQGLPSAYFLNREN